MAKGKNVLTTGDVAKICNVAPRTVSKWFDSGQLKGYRIPGSKDRRIPMSELVRFMKIHNMPIDGLPAGNIRVLIVDINSELSEQLAQDLRNKADYDVEIVHSTFETGLAAQKFAPHVMLISLMNGEIAAAEICKSIRCDEELQTIKILVMAEHLTYTEQSALMQKGFDGYVEKDASVEDLIRKIEETTAIIY